MFHYIPVFFPSDYYSRNMTHKTWSPTCVQVADSGSWPVLCLSYVIIAHSGDSVIYHWSSAWNVSCLEISNSSSHRFALLLCEHLLSISVVCASGPLIPQNPVCVCARARTHAGAWFSQTEKTVALLTRQYPVDESSVKETVTQKGSNIYCSLKRSFLVCS